MLNFLSLLTIPRKLWLKYTLLIATLSELNSLIINAYLLKHGFAVIFAEIFPSAQRMCIRALAFTQHDVIRSCLTCPDPSDNS